MCSPFHASFLSTGRHLPADPSITDDDPAAGTELIAAGASATSALDPQPSVERQPVGPDAGWAPAPGSRQEMERC
jgi:hypothetical protein